MQKISRSSSIWSLIFSQLLLVIVLTTFFLLKNQLFTFWLFCLLIYLFCLYLLDIFEKAFWELAFYAKLAIRNQISTVFYLYCELISMIKILQYACFNYYSGFLHYFCIFSYYIFNDSIFICRILNKFYGIINYFTFIVNFSFFKMVYIYRKFDYIYTYTNTHIYSFPGIHKIIIQIVQQKNIWQVYFLYMCIALIYSIQIFFFFFVCFITKSLLREDVQRILMHSLSRDFNKIILYLFFFSPWVLFYLWCSRY